MTGGETIYFTLSIFYTGILLVPLGSVTGIELINTLIKSCDILFQERKQLGENGRMKILFLYRRFRRFLCKGAKM